ncbi:patatin-like phospholipase family protein [Streptomonospora wellingtoniae]|uniref:Patatin-like phospholipase family protein n=1 Tax=Streptomonospora wellingtoniae TaxID=3075544 RepID=A0ABU2KZZ4_9ACTN|nr:patatin-like phospholipase family protein [Streptomonospora sp. DSM 45055]MDT0304827.1 patatin-like phospholipase family protein [Streptomonospora sp. DSM 45055]
MGRTLVLGGGGVTGIAWELGVLAGLREAGLDLSAADTVVGTSAGSVVGAQITSGAAIEDLYARQLRPPDGEIAARLHPGVLARWAWAFVRERDPRRARARIGRMAHAGSGSSVAERRRVIASRLPSVQWPRTDLLIAAVDARTGERAVFERTTGAALVDAVTASCAVPGVWPPAVIGGRPYIDGGVHSTSNADLAAGSGGVVALCPIARGAGPLPGPADELAALEASGARTALVSPDAAAVAAIGPNVLDPAARAASARAGRAQAPAVAERIAGVWGRE